ncbi:hypothetical protein JAB6_53660 [Janthinobacterium sp. HH104]|uniref:hypothetical protein n=1 Tax=Janthinobacterium sp. HH104 TaxID=1537276 RepID=UPI000893183A|nr:hypothetical protein [Janthinobacterium sp. HH104]OEZ76568.1 hypothetical protein JAB6_53660 [Janthinobacterium sp. HH104]
MDICNKCKTGLWTVVSHCPYCGHVVAGATQPAAAVPPPLPVPVPPPVAPKPPPAPAPKAVPKPAVVPPPAPPKPAQPQAVPKPAPVPPSVPPVSPPPRKWLRWLGGIAVLAAVIVYMNGKPGGKNESACNDAIDSGLKLVANGSLDGARQKLATAKNVCTGKSSAKADDLQAAIGKAGAASSGCQRSVRAIERAIDGHQLQSAAKGIAGLDIDCAGASSVDSLRKQLARQQAAAASVLVGVRQAFDGKDAVAARNGIARLEAIDREAVELSQLKADVQALSATAAPAPAPVSTPAAVPAPAQQEPAPVRAVERSAVAERRPLETSPVDSGAAMRNEMAQSFLRDAERSLLEGKFDAAKTYLESARRVDPGNARIDNLSRRIRERERQVLQTETTIN